MSYITFSVGQYIGQVVYTENGGHNNRYRSILLNQLSS